ncbi:F420-dependent methylenetetrahydromethanopterin dehydrogenase [Methanothermobacter marburgensis]|uniref:F420-dependent methylenetetrahydromethanopterin dehydrogenase n=1 Tax=Methanothermobacter marburgensis (strain ATCC BAA-927 / DSM 2133 / JCM 14651 / NBRC 100331 / OCM 82 / Marburg) TaxID=79929 RepID=MTD_METTM|nr:F420-dependent methylenetetrahydromethanopterin dehydrogenase [Methanothermobacter marburgensis]P55300.3 RecName: Full=F420-dependent methylenetetrahydromethanopterin dehydrogenase; Short=MTD; AltName: Full=Coenzyme F420-dependent N5,N10-methylenetetrahydromethanopterin dehydrogenase [Methanothermobacter marburgensis str. Marburg]pir/B55712/ methylenetetrahydromethanopterin dehydrogenase (EC 1.5.99.9) - Methanobacterium thermoautotrophicum (strain Marburg) [Methanothermobacter thermautotrophic
MVVKIGIIKCGNIGTSPVLDLLLDERADRPNIDVCVVGSGAKMNPDEIERAVPTMLEMERDFVIFISPNPGAPGPAKARELLSAADVPAMIIGDAPGLRVKDEIEEQGLGYIIVKADPMIGARREFLDPTEMASFNSDVIKVLAFTGAYRVVQNTIDAMIADVEAGKAPELPQVVIDTDKAVEAAGYTNPYAKAKAMAAYEIATKVADIDVRGCFMVQDPDQYIPIVASAHEMLSAAAKLAIEAREIEKANDTVLRTPHGKEGKTLSKKDLLAKPE